MINLSLLFFIILLWTIQNTSALDIKPHRERDSLVIPRSSAIVSIDKAVEKTSTRITKGCPAREGEELAKKFNGTTFFGTKSKLGYKRKFEDEKKVEKKRKTSSDCIIELRSVGNFDNIPLILNISDDMRLCEVKSNEILVESNQKVNLLCSGDKNKLKSVAGYKSLAVKCIDGIFKIADEKLLKDFHRKEEKLSCSIERGIAGFKNVTEECKIAPYHTLDNSTFNMDDFQCIQTPESLIRKFVGYDSFCKAGHELWEVGFELDIHKFIGFYKICRDNSNNRTAVVRFDLPRAMRTISLKRQSFKMGNVSGENQDHLYKALNKKLVDLQPLLDKKYSLNATAIDNRQIIDRGHLVANGYYGFAFHRKATYYFYNTAPQWHSFNAIEWHSLETEILYKAPKENVFIGVFGHVNLAYKNGTSLPLYLDMNKKIAPVPEIFFMYTPGHDFVAGFNNPFLDKDERKSKQEDFCIKKDCPLELPAVLFCCEPKADLLDRVGIRI